MAILIVSVYICLYVRVCGSKTLLEVCVRVYVCVCESERERESESGSKRYSYCVSGWTFWDYESTSATIEEESESLFYQYELSFFPLSGS